MKGAIAWASNYSFVKGRHGMILHIDGNEMGSALLQRNELPHHAPIISELFFIILSNG